MNLLLRDEYLQSGVMICITKINDIDYIILEKRAESIRQAGEISFPGGKRDKEDKSFMETAIRETKEELGVNSNKIKDVSYFGTLVSATGAILECFISNLILKDFDDLNYNKAEVDKLLFVPIKFFIDNEPIIESIEVRNRAINDISKYNFPKKYSENWTLPDRKIKIYMYENEAIWGMTAEVIFAFIETLKKEKEVGFFEYNF